MSDFLQFKNELIDGQPKYYVTDNADGTKNIALANPIIEQGTPLNRNGFNRLNAVLGYEKIIGNVDYENKIVNYNYPYLEQDEIVDNMRILVKGGNIPKTPANDFNVIKDYIDISTYSYNQIIPLTNEKFILFSNSDNNCYYTIVNNSGNTIISNKELPQYYYEYKAIHLSNNNIMIISNSNSDYRRGAFTILDENGNVLNSGELSDYYKTIEAIELSNTNIMIMTSNTSSSPTNYITILDNNGNIVLDKKNSFNTMIAYKLLQLSNGNIFMVARSSRGNPLTGAILDENGNTISSESLTNINGNVINCYELENGNIAVATNTTFGIIDNNLNVLYTPYTYNIASDFTPHILELEDNNIMVVVSSNYRDRSEIILFSENGNLIERNIIPSYYQKSTLIKMANGNILVSFSDGSIIIDTNADIIKDSNIAQGSISAELYNGNIAFARSDFFGILQPISIEYLYKINGTNVDTMFSLDGYYELVYNEAQDKFIAEEVRNAN